MAPPSKKIGFPAGVIGSEPLRIDVVADASPFFIALNKPAGVLFDSYSGAPRSKSIILAMRASPEKPEFKSLGLVSPLSANQIDFEISGVAIVACGKSAAAGLRNAAWSGAMEFEYEILAESDGGRNGDSFEVDLPIFMHSRRPVWLVSHRYGKKARTFFELIEESGGYQLWRARAKNVRPHQIRVHAGEAGLRIAGESVYSETRGVYVSSMKGGYYKSSGGEAERPLYPNLFLHLSKISFDGSAAGCGALGEIVLRAPLPKGFSACLKRLGFKRSFA